jgi:hypothetical protein
MSEAVSISGAVFDYPQKGHDRLFIDDTHSFAGIFDGSGGAELSQSIVNHLPDIISSHEPELDVSTGSFLTNTVRDLDNLDEGRFRKSTGALAVALQRDTLIELSYANAGDSSIYFYDHYKDLLTRVAHTPSRIINGRFIDTTGFLGSFRTSDEISGIVSRLVIPARNTWSLIGFSDGIQDDDGQGISESDLREIVRDVEPGFAAGMILNHVSPPYDDASVFVMSRHPGNS